MKEPLINRLNNQVDEIDGNYSEGDKVQRKYTKGNLEYVEERPLNKSEEQ